MNVAQLILDYVAICEKRGEVLNFSDFIELWKEADEITQEHFSGAEAPET